MCKIAIRKAGMKQDDIARVLNVSQSVVSRPLKEHRVAAKEKGNGLHWFLSARSCYWSIMVRGALSDDHMIQLKVVTGTLNSQKYQDQILESGVRPPLDSLDGQNMSERTLQDLTLLISSRNTKINRTSLAFHGRACCQTWTLSNMCGTSSAEVFGTGNQPYQNHCEFC